MSINLGSTIKSFWEDKRKFRLSLLILILLAGFGIFRSCSSTEKEKRSSYRIARDINWAPLNLTGRELSMRAFSDDLLYAIANKMHLRISILSTNYGTLLEGLDDGKYDGILSVLTPNVANQTHYDFSNPFYLLGPVLLVQAKSPITSLNEMEGKIVGVKSGASSVYNVDKFPTILILAYDNMLTALDDLSKNKIDGVIIDAWRAHLYTEGDYKDKVKIVTPPLTKEGLRLVTLKNPEFDHLIDSFNEGLEDLKKDGTYNELLKKWDIFNTEIPKSS